MTGVACCSIIISWSVVANYWPKLDSASADKRLKSIWKFFRPFLFPLIGSSVSLIHIPLSIMIQCLVIVCASIAVKALTMLMVGYSVGFDAGERLFVSGIWTGKASVQVRFYGSHVLFRQHFVLQH